MLTRYLWITDPHFDFLSTSKFVDFLRHLQTQQATGLFLTGDISVGDQLIQHLKMLSEELTCTTYFVLGNHDFYRSSFATQHEALKSLVHSKNNLKYLTTLDPLPLSQDTCIIGHDGWYDSRWRDPWTSVVFSCDYFFIKDFKNLPSNKERLELVRKKADQAAEELRQKLEQSLRTYSTVYLLTHFPPWPEVDPSWGGIFEKFWAPYNSSKVMADTLISTMNKHVDKKIVILAGHTHTKRVEKISDNIELRVGDAATGTCQVQDIISI